MGVKVTCDRQEQLKISREQIDKNIKMLRWRIGKAEPDVVQQLTCCLARSMLIYIGTPLMGVGLWRREDVDRVEASLYRKIMRIGNDIPNTVILNTMTNIRLAGDVVYYLSREVWSEYRRQHRVTKYFDQIEDRETGTTVDNGENNDTVMENSADGHPSLPATTTARKQKQSHNSGGGGTNRYQKYSTKRKFQEKIYVPKAMMDLMISTTTNKTSIHFGMNHMCHRHNQLFTIDHIEQYPKTPKPLMFQM